MANNRSTAKKLFDDRITMTQEINPDDEVVFFDHFFAESILYGTVDEDSTVVVPNPNKLVTIKGQERTTHQVFDFALEMFARVKANIRMKVALGQVATDNQDIIKLKPRRAYEPPSKSYSTYFEDIVVLYETFLVEERALENITSFDDYVKNFFYFLEINLKNTPVTLSGFMKSKYNSIFSTGLAISISGASSSDDSERAKFLLTNCFSYFKKICLNEGFYLLQETPWVMLVNLQSPKTIDVLKNYNFSNTNIINNTSYFNKVYNIEYKYIRNILIERYNNLTNIYPSYFKSKIYGVKKTITELHYRNPYNPAGRHTDDFWIDFFIHLKNLEDPIFSDRQLEEIKDYRKKIQKLFDKNVAMSYINIIFKDRFRDEPFAFRSLFQMFLKQNKLELQELGITGESVNLGGSSGGY